MNASDTKKHSYAEGRNELATEVLYMLRKKWTKKCIEKHMELAINRTEKTMSLCHQGEL